MASALPILDRTRPAHGSREPARHPASLDSIVPPEQDPVTSDCDHRAPASVDALDAGRDSIAGSGSLVGPDGSSRRRAAMLRLIRASASSKRLVAGSSTDSSGAGACGRAGASSTGIWSGAGAAFWSGAGAVFCGCWRRHSCGILDEPVRLGRFVNCQAWRRILRLLGQALPQRRRRSRALVDRSQDGGLLCERLRLGRADLRHQCLHSERARGRGTAD